MVDWTMNEFSRADLGDVRRAGRAAAVVEALVRHQPRSLAGAMRSDAATKACYRLLNNNMVEHGTLLAGHVKCSLERASSHPVVLAVQDTTTLSYGGREPIAGLGPVDSQLSTQGFFVHTNLLVEPEHGEVLGVAHQQVWARSWTPASRTERADQRKKRARESEHWAAGQEELAKAMGRIRDEGTRCWSPLPEGAPRIIAVFDREGDVFEAIEALDDLGHGFVIRAVHNRLLKTPLKPEGLGRKWSSKQVQDELFYSMTAIAHTRPLGEVPFEVPRHSKQPARSTRLTLRSASIELLPPKSRERRGASRRVNIVLVREERPPAGVSEPICWYLLTSEPCATLAEALRIVEMYRHRWKIEEFHMGLKTGCGVERAQLESFEALKNLVALASIGSWYLLSVRDAARSGAPSPPPGTVTGLQLQLLKAEFPKLGDQPTAREVLRAIAMLGGFLGRKGDGEPGWRTLWWGYQELLSMEAGARLLLGDAVTCGRR